MKLSDLIGACESGGYIGGEVFINEHGQTIYFDGKRLIGVENVSLKSSWTYAGVKKVAS